jgi:hypothetical protein
MNDETPNGVLLKAADGSHYFIPATDLSQYAAPHVTEEKSDEVKRAASQIDAYSIDASSSDAAIAAGIGFGG